MNDVQINITVPHWIAEYLMEMCQAESEYWHEAGKKDDYADLWAEIGGEIESAIEEADAEPPQ